MIELHFFKMMQVLKNMSSQSHTLLSRQQHSLQRINNRNIINLDQKFLEASLSSKTQTSENTPKFSQNTVANTYMFMKTTKPISFAATKNARTRGNKPIAICPVGVETNPPQRRRTPMN